MRAGAVYHFATPAGKVAASHLDELLESLSSSALRLDSDSLVGHIAGPYAPRPGATFFAGVSQPAGSVTKHPIQRRAAQSQTLENAAGRLRELIREVGRTYAPREPAAVAVSSGMDSTAVMAVLCQQGANLLAVTWTSPSVPESDEARWARSAAAMYGLELLEIEIEPEGLLPEQGVITRRSTPLVNIFDFLWRRTAREISDHGRRVLYTGYSGDHLFGGHIPAAADMLLSLRWLRLVDYLRTAGDRYPGFIQALRSELVSPLLRQAAPQVWARRREPVPWLHLSRTRQWRERQMEAVGPGLRPGRAERISRLTDGMLSQLSESLDHQVEPHGVEVKHPLLDERLIDFALSLPTWLLNDGRNDKVVFREAMRGLLPDEIVELDNILPGAIARRAVRSRSEPLLELTHNMRAAELGYVDESLLSEHVSAFMDHTHDDLSFWNTLTLEDWLRRWW